MKKLLILLFAINLPAFALFGLGEDKVDTKKDCEPPQWAIAIGHKEMWKEHNGCLEEDINENIEKKSKISNKVNLKVQKITNNIYALVGETGQRSPENFGNNSTHGVIIGKDSVILIDSGASFLGAKQIDEVIKTLTDKPVKMVINTGGQDHRWLGNDYFQKRGAKVISSKKAKIDQIDRTDYHLNRLSGLIKKSLDGTIPSYPDEVFEREKKIKFAGIDLELYHFGSSHTIGNIMVWLPKDEIMFSGDTVYVERALGVGPAKDIKSWIKVFEKMANFKPKYIVPGHGSLTNIKQATKNTYDYLVLLKNKVNKVLDDDGSTLDAMNINQDKFKYLKNFESIAKRNAQNVFQQLEFD